MRDPNDPCLFCTPRSITRRNALAYCARDSFPVSPGHSLVMPFRHCASFFELSPEEVAACMALVGHERQALDDEFRPDGYNVGVNVGPAGGDGGCAARGIRSGQPPELVVTWRYIADDGVGAAFGLAADEVVTRRQ